MTASRIALLCVAVATVAKLVRNVFMAVVVPFMAFAYSRKNIAQPRSVGERAGFVRFLPLFVVGFLALAVVRSAGDAWISVEQQVGDG